MLPKTKNRRSHSTILIWIVAFALGSFLEGYSYADGSQRAVTIEAMKFSPSPLEVKVGDVVTWTNKDLFPHTVTAEDHSFDSGEIPVGGVWKMTAKQTGTFSYLCTLHPTMHDTLVVK